MKYPIPESINLEFKREIPQNNQIIKTIIGFCNQNGGRLIIGIADDCTIIGLPEKDIELAMESMERAIYDACTPSILPRISTQIFENKRIIIIDVSEGMNKPYYRRSEGLMRGTYIRLGRTTARATPEIIKELEWQARGIDFECLPTHLSSQDDLENEKIKTFLSERLNQGKTILSEEILKRYNIITYEHSKIYPSIAGILLFGRNPQAFLSEAMIICSHFKGKNGREVIATVDCNGTLFSQFNQAFHFITERLQRSFIIKTAKRNEKLELPVIAIREALLNMIVHRNYHIKAPSKIAIYDDRIEFFSPGQFPGPLDTRDLTKGISYLRNPIICKIMREAGYIEKLGSGFIEIFESYKKMKLQIPIIIEGENYIKCILPRVLQDKSHIEENDLDKLKQLLIIKPEITVGDVIRHLLVSRSTALRRINELLKTKILKKVGNKKAVRYFKIDKQ
ncbi:MAG: putative DNA binding domain-containing protein [Gammaproteobacteria bacterium]|nr:putative DNA binding domain-containing protein [Gammaproteobacteria bacterium]